MLVCNGNYNILAQGQAYCEEQWIEVTQLFTANDALALIQLALLPIVLAYAFRVIRKQLY